MCIYLSSMKKKSFNTIVKDATENIEAWNKKVKYKKYHLYDSDSHQYKEIKIYRYLNENVGCSSKSEI